MLARCARTSFRSGEPARGELPERLAIRARSGARYHANPTVVCLPGCSELSNLETVDYRERITIEPGKRGGKPCIRGLRITVDDVLSSLAAGMSEDEILADFPDLEREDFRAVYAFAADRERRLMTDPAA